MTSHTVMCTSLCAAIIATVIHTCNIGTSILVIAPFMLLLFNRFPHSPLSNYIAALSIFAGLVQNGMMMYTVSAMCLHLPAVRGARDEPDGTTDVLL